MHPKRKKEKRRRRPPSRKPTGMGLWRVISGLMLMLLLLLLAGGALHQFLLRGGPSRQKGPGPIPSSALRLTPTFEIFPDEPDPSEAVKSTPPAPIPPAAPEQEAKPSRSHRPRIAIVIDDIGYDVKIAHKFIKLDSAISLAILPHTPFQKKISSIAQKSGVDILLHLPMEPLEYPRILPGEGALLVEMPPEELSAVLRENLLLTQGIRGVNNHMGSRFTTHPEPLKTVFAELKKRNLFFLDSRTNPDSCAESVAKTVGVSFAKRNIFLDHVATAEFTRQQLAKLLAIAQREGSAIGIGHPIESTYTELAAALPGLKIHAAVVPVSQAIGFNQD